MKSFEIIKEIITCFDAKYFKVIDNENSLIGINESNYARGSNVNRKIKQYINVPIHNTM